MDCTASIFEITTGVGSATVIRPLATWYTASSCAMLYEPRSLRERERKQRFEALRCCILGVRYAATQPSMYKSFGRCARAHSVLRYASRFTGSVLWFTNWIDVRVLASCLRPVLRKNPHAAEAVKLQHQQIPLIARSTEVGLNQGNRCGCALPGPGRVGEGWVRGGVR